VGQYRLLPRGRVIRRNGNCNGNGSRRTGPMERLRHRSITIPISTRRSHCRRRGVVPTVTMITTTMTKPRRGAGNWFCKACCKIQPPLSKRRERRRGERNIANVMSGKLGMTFCYWRLSDFQNRRIPAEGHPLSHANVFGFSLSTRLARLLSSRRPYECLYSQTITIRVAPDSSSQHSRRPQRCPPS
jgi:hypothetical protein